MNTRNRVLKGFKTQLNTSTFEALDGSLPNSGPFTDQVVAKALVTAIDTARPPGTIRDVEFISPILRFGVDRGDAIYG